MISVDLTFSQYGTRVLHDAFYCNDIKTITGGLYESGYPHNGGEHSLVIKGEKQDVLAMIDLWNDEYGVQPELVTLKNYIDQVDLKRYTLKRIFYQPFVNQ